MTDLSATIAAKSDQLNSDDLMGGPIDIEITKVRGCSEPEQPIAIHFVGDEGKPYKPCKTIRRVLVAAWGPEGKDYVGRRLRLYRDDGVKFGGIQVGGIRISHMSHLQNDLAVPVNITRGKKAAYTVKALKSPPATRQERPAEPREARREAPETGGFSGGFGPAPADDEGEPSAAVAWMRGVQEDLEGDVFRSTADLDAFFADADNQAQFAALEAESPDLAKRLNAALTGRNKALAGRRG